MAKADATFKKMIESTKRSFSLFQMLFQPQSNDPIRNDADGSINCD